MSKDYELRVINKPMYYIEMVALLNRLSRDSSYKGIPLKENEIKFLDIIKGFRLEGLELFELFLIHENLDSIDIIEKEINALNRIDFIYFVLGEELTKKEIEGIVEQPSSIYESSLPPSCINNSMMYLIENTREFANRLIDIFKVLDKVVIEQLALQHIYEESVSKISLDLKSKVPLDVAQDIMGKKFKRVYDFNTYYFAVSYFYTNKPMRTFNHNTQIVVYPIQEAGSYNKDMLANALRIIGDSTRLDIIEKLSKRPMFGKELAAQLGIVTSTVSHHLEQLRSIGLIHEERVKNVKYFSINRNEYNLLCEALKRFIEEDKK